MNPYNHKEHNSRNRKPKMNRRRGELIDLAMTPRVQNRVTTWGRSKVRSRSPQGIVEGA